MGHTSLWMFPTYAIGFTFLNIFNDVKSYYKKPMWIQTLLGGIAITVIELISGIILIHWLGIQAWDYSSEFLNLYGVICLKSYVLFTLSVPLGIWLVDIVDYYLYGNITKYSILKNYIDLVTLK
jgi:uncharacterized membrane protein